MPVGIEQRGGVAILTLDDPERRNALSAPLVADIVAAVDALDEDESVGAIVVTGAPPAFCAGADLSDLAAATGDTDIDRGASPDDTGAAERSVGDVDSAAGDALRAIYEGFLRIARCSLPTVAAVNGPAVGAGLNMAMACDVRVAAESARFDARFLAIGLHPGGGGTWLLHQALGPQATAALSLFGEVVDGRRAEAIGLVWRCVADGELLDTAVEFADRAASAPRELARRVKRTLQRWPEVTTHEDAVEIEFGPQIWSVRQPEFAVRLEALRQRMRSSD